MNYNLHGQSSNYQRGAIAQQARTMLAIDDLITRTRTEDGQVALIRLWTEQCHELQRLITNQTQEFDGPMEINNNLLKLIILLAEGYVPSKE